MSHTGDMGNFPLDELCSFYPDVETVADLLENTGVLGPSTSLSESNNQHVSSCLYRPRGHC